MDQPFPVEYLSAPANLGYSWAANLGIERSTNDEVVIISNADVSWCTGAIERLREGAAVGALCAPAQFRTDGTLNPDTLQPTVSRSTSVLRWSGLLGWRHRSKCASRFAALSHGDVVVVGTDTGISGAVVAGQRAVWDRIGGWDDKFFLYFEDADLTYRAKQLQIPCVILGNAAVLHDSGTGRRELRPDLLRAAILSERHAWRKQNITPAALLAVAQSVGLLLRAIVAAAHGDSARAAKYWSVLRRAQ